MLCCKTTERRIFIFFFCSNVRISTTTFSYMRIKLLPHLAFHLVPFVILVFLSPTPSTHRHTQLGAVFSLPFSLSGCCCCWLLRECFFPLHSAFFAFIFLCLSIYFCFAFCDVVSAFFLSLSYFFPLLISSQNIDTMSIERGMFVVRCYNGIVIISMLGVDVVFLSNFCCCCCCCCFVPHSFPHSSKLFSHILSTQTQRQRTHMTAE